MAKVQSFTRDAKGPHERNQGWQQHFEVGRANIVKGETLNREQRRELERRRKRGKTL